MKANVIAPRACGARAVRRRAQVLEGDALVGERAFAVAEHGDDEARLSVEFVGVENFFDGIARPVGFHKRCVPLRDVERDGREPRDA